MFYLKRIGNYNRNEPHSGTDTFGCSSCPPSMQSAGGVDDSKVAIYTDTEKIKIVYLLYYDLPDPFSCDSSWLWLPKITLLFKLLERFCPNLNFDIHMLQQVFSISSNVLLNRDIPQGCPVN